MISTNTTAIIFDLGGVILNLDYEKTAIAFKNLGLTDFDTVYSQLAQNELFDQFETGKISTFYFVNRILDKLPQGCTANQVVHAWNAMILDFPAERLNWLSQLSSRYRLFLLSNTNALHMEAVRRSLEKTVGHQRLEVYFERIFLSHEMGMRKPNPEIFMEVCKICDLNPSNTVFIDDSPQHVEGAKQIELNAIHLTKNQNVESLFD